MKQFHVKRAVRPPMPASVMADLKKINGSTDENETPVAVTRCVQDKPPIFINSIFKVSQERSGMTSVRTKEENLDMLMQRSAEMKIKEADLKNPSNRNQNRNAYSFNQNK